METITLAGSGLVFQNVYGLGVSSAYRSAIISAENFFQSHFTNPVTLTIDFEFAPLSFGETASNSFSPVQNVSYAALRNALQAHATTANDLTAVASLPATDPTGGEGFSVAVGMARILGLAGSAKGSVDDTVWLNSNLFWSFGQDAAGAIEHEISEGSMGRVGGLGIQDDAWGPLDLFRYSAPGQHDYSGGKDGLPAYFSVDGTHLLTQFHNSITAWGRYDGQDFGDWANTSGDAFGPSGPNSPGIVNDTDLRVLDILGWTPSGASSSSTPALGGNATPTSTPASSANTGVNVTFYADSTDVVDTSSGFLLQRLSSSGGDSMQFLSLDGAMYGRNLASAGTLGLNPSHLRDYDGNNLGNGGGWQLLGLAAVRAGDRPSYILENSTSGRWAEVAVQQNGQIDFSRYGANGDTRVVGIYIDPLVQAGVNALGGPLDSQTRFLQDVQANRLAVLGSFTDPANGAQDLFFKLTNHAADHHDDVYLRAVLWGDGNIQYANYMDSGQLTDWAQKAGMPAGDYSSWLTRI